MSSGAYNNLGISSLGILSVLRIAKELSLPELLLILPFVTHAQLLNHLARRNVTARSLEELIVKHPRWFSNFNERYYSSLATSLNTIQLLCDIKITSWEGRYCTLEEDFPYDNKMGTRAAKMYGAAENIAKLITFDVANAYTNLRIQL